MDNKRFEIKPKRIERESTTVRAENTHQMFDKWSSIAPSREAVLKKRNKSNRFSILRKLLRWVNKWKADQTTPAPKSLAVVIEFFLWWKNHHDNKTIDSVDLNECLGAEFFDVRDTLKEIRAGEAKDWDGGDLNNLNEVVNFLDERSK